MDGYSVYLVLFHALSSLLLNFIVFARFQRRYIRAAGVAFACLFPLAFPEGAYRRVAFRAYAVGFCGGVRGSSANAIDIIIVGHYIRVFVETFKKYASIHEIHLHKERRRARGRRWSCRAWGRPDGKKAGQGNHSERR